MALPGLQLHLTAVADREVLQVDQVVLVATMVQVVTKVVEVDQVM